MDRGLPVKESLFRRMLPAITLMLFAPLNAEILSGATRMSVAPFVFPIEVIIWGGGTVLIREVVRRLRLGWVNLVLLAVALSIAEEFVIQQTSLAPLVVKLKGVEYGRAFGVNYVYLVWAVLYEVTFVVLLPIGMAELVFWRRRTEGWLNGWGIGIIAVLFLPACRAAWFGWTQIARIKVFHMEPYSPPVSRIVAGVIAIMVLTAVAVGPTRRWLANTGARLKPPYPLVLLALSGIAVVVLFALETLAFGIAPNFPPAAAVGIGLVLSVVLLRLAPRFWAHDSWSSWHTVGLLYGAIFANMAITFVAVQDAPAIDFWGKAIADMVAVVLMVWLAIRLPVANPTRARN